MLVKHFHREKDFFVCDVCPQHCKLTENETGICFGRSVVGGQFVVSNYLKIVSLSIDPIEKKPLYHFFPSSKILSTGPNGCNLSCRWCQNCEISQSKTITRKIDPDTLASNSVSDGSIGLAYTYSEPLIWQESILEIAPRVREMGGKNVLVTNGMIEVEPLKEILPYIDAANVDLKFIRKDLYKKYTKGDLNVVQRTIEILKSASCHLELTHLIVSEIADDSKHFLELVKWVQSFDHSTPLHISRYFPRFKWDKKQTDSSFMEQAQRMGSEYLEFIYVGNIGGFDNNTLCPSCGKLLISRNGYSVSVEGVDNNGMCRQCGRDVGIVMA